MAEEVYTKMENLTTKAQTYLSEDEELKDYQDLINQKAAVDSPDVLPNAGKDHAAIVMSKMFDKTKEYVNMIVGNFNGAISNKQNYMESLENCLNRHVTFNIIFLDDPNPNSLAYNLLIQKKREGEKIHLYKGSTQFKESLTKDRIEKHFSIFDKNKYRFEKDTKKFLAWFSFNDEENATKLLGVFKRGLKSASPI